MKTPDINGKTPEEIKQGLVCGFCYECQYDDDKLVTVEECARQVHDDALAYIHQLESRLVQADRERDAAVADILHVLHTKGTIDAECLICDMEKPDCRWECEKAKWRGVCPENTKEDA